MAAWDRKNADKPDIAIADFTEIWPSFSQIRGAEAIDLDTCREFEHQKYLIKPMIAHSL
jgi:hypothetical protein